MYKDIVVTKTLRFWSNGTVEILPIKTKKELKMFITFKCGVCNRFIKRNDIKKQPQGQTFCPHCNYHFEEQA